MRETGTNSQQRKRAHRKEGCSKGEKIKVNKTGGEANKKVVRGARGETNYGSEETHGEEERGKEEKEEMGQPAMRGQPTRRGKLASKGQPTN